MNPKKISTKPSSSRWRKYLSILTFLGILSVGLSFFFAYHHIYLKLPDIHVLRDVQYQIPLTVYSKNGKLIAQFGEKKRAPITTAEAPEKLIQAVLAAEDDRFFDHPGVDYKGLLRATIKYILTGEKRQGGSTITMQVARNFFLTPEKTFLRKIKEIFLAIKIENELSKYEILELYLNKIYLGHRAYGVGAAAQVYYGKKLVELDLSQLAMIAGLPKAPSIANPITNPERAIKRRNYVLRRMHELDLITSEQFQHAIKQPTTAQLYTVSVEANAPYIAEMVREKMYLDYGEKAYTDGYKVYTTIDSTLQKYASTALQTALYEYSERHGFRGPLGHIDPVGESNNIQWLKELESFTTIGNTVPGVVTSVGLKSVQVLLTDSKTIEIQWPGLKWARKYRSINSQGPSPKSASNILQQGDIIRVRLTSDDEWRLAQTPSVEGALVSLNPDDGSIVALTGGFDFYRSKYNRAIQAKRQPGSGFKPILYTKALEEGFTAASIINDAPVVFDEPTLETEWRPKNYSGKFYGPTRLRVALRKSRNLVSVRLARELGITSIIDSGLRFGLPKEQLPKTLSLALGSGTATPLEMARVYAVFANGGFLVDPYFINQIETVKGEIIFQASPKIACSDCSIKGFPTQERAPRVVSTRINYLMNSLLQDVIKSGTARRALQLNRTDLAGKTGTSNEQRDAWFNGFNPYLVTIAWVGFDSSKPLGFGETGGRAALPMWISYMKDALKDVPEIQSKLPNEIVSVRIDSETGLLAPPTQEGIFEIFRSENVPTLVAPPPQRSDSNGDSFDQQEIQSLF